MDQDLKNKTAEELDAMAEKATGPERDRLRAAAREKRAESGDVPGLSTDDDKPISGGPEQQANYEAQKKEMLEKNPNRR